MQIAGVQMDIRLGDPAANLDAMEGWYKRARGQGAELVVFPECAVSGYCFDSRQAALPFAETLPGPATDRFTAICREQGGHVVFGLLERDGDRLYNALALVGPEGLIGKYRKVHLPFLGVDRFTDYGDQPFALHTINGVRVGMIICYDAGFPEPARCLTLMGADVIVLPTNWPPGAECAAAYAINTRAMENTVYFAAINRIGTEAGVPFIGQSRICDPLGATLASAEHVEEALLVANINVERSRQKHLIRKAGLNEIDRIADRRPEMYGKITEPHQLVRPGR